MAQVLYTVQVTYGHLTEDQVRELFPAFKSMPSNIGSAQIGPIGEEFKTPNGKQIVVTTYGLTKEWNSWEHHMDVEGPEKVNSTDCCPMQEQGS